MSLTDMEKWRGSDNGYGQEDGLDNTNLEMFKKDPKSSGTRETGQNGIDANEDRVHPTRIVYKSFQIPRDEIPGMDQLTDMIQACYDFKKDLPKEEVPLKRMLKSSKASNITCLRISDFNTTGLLGVKSNKREQPFYLLTKGAGVSYKSNGKGGSKGIGKYATFVNSNVNTVFYSTYTKEEEKGFIGVTKLRSVPINNDGLMTQEMHYYCRNDKKEPILRELKLDKDFSRSEGEYGTDIFIIGFKDEEDWEWTVISKFLESFMVAFKEKTLVVEVNDILISDETLGSLVTNEKLQKACTKRFYKEICAQYALLFDDDIYKTTISIGEYGDVDIYVKKYDSQNADMGIQKCVLVRYPYMKIKLSETLSKIPFSAMCVIGDNGLNDMLRAVENAQHTDWEFNRLDDKAERKKTKEAEKELRAKIKEYITSIMFIGGTTETDVYGAGDFLPSLDENSDRHASDSNIIEDAPYVSKPRVSKPTTPKKNKLNEDSDVFDYDTGDIGDETEDGDAKKRTDEHGQGGGGIGGKTYERTEGDNDILAKHRLDGIAWKNIVVDEKAGKYDIIFTSPYDEKDFEIELKMCGDGQDTYSLNIENAYVNGEESSIIDGKVRFSIEKGKKYKVSYEVPEKKMFSSEVVLNAYR